MKKVLLLQVILVFLFPSGVCPDSEEAGRIFYSSGDEITGTVYIADDMKVWSGYPVGIVLGNNTDEPKDISAAEYVAISISGDAYPLKLSKIINQKGSVGGAVLDPGAEVDIDGFSPIDGRNVVKVRIVFDDGIQRNFKPDINLLLDIMPDYLASQITSNQWVIQPGKSIYSILYDEGGVIESTDALPWPDGRSALIIYIRTDNAFYRCVDYKDQSFESSWFICYKLANP